ncbi:MAG: Zn-ribbon domain-containing OB-fold protein [Acidobacteriota bacterium]|jgi:hypothetical protein
MTTPSSARLTREYPARYRLEGARCLACGEILYPRRLVCPACGAREFAAHRLASHGVVKTFTVIHVAGSAFKHQVPYILAVVALEGGGTLTCELTDLVDQQPEIGMPVELQFRRIQEDGEAGVIAYGHKAVPR